MRLEEVFKIVLGYEGGFSNDPSDRGGKTKYGITNGTLLSAQSKGWMPGNLRIEDITQEHAMKIYELGYWKPVRADELPEPLDLIMFDAAVNHGVGGAVKLLQEALNSILSGSDLAVDGAFGPKTMSALEKVVKKSEYLTWKNPELEDNFLLRYLCVDILMNRTELFSVIADKDESQRKFLRGWIHNRVVGLAKKAGLE
jgi:lysozyme family protein